MSSFVLVIVSVVVLVFGVESQRNSQQYPYQSYGGGGDAGGGYGGQGVAGSGGYGSSSGSSEGSYQTETKYYYGGKYQGSCSTDGLYYFDDTMFVICSNGYPHEQPCPPGTKTSGSPKYQAGYYYGYTDLCSVNLVDYGYGPEYYAPKGYPIAGDGYGSDRKDGYGDKGAAGYGGHESHGAHDKKNVKESYPSKSREYGSYEHNGAGPKDAYPKDNRIPYSGTKDAYPQRGAYPQADAYPSNYKDTYSPAKSPYGATPEKKYP